MTTPCMRGRETLAATIVAWQRQHGRHDLPWQGTTDAYRIWLSEIMLQQTQVATVMGYYDRFLQRFPDVAALAHATQDDVMPFWAGLGYYARARNLHRCAQTIIERYQGEFPATSAELATLPGIGRSTAAAIAAFAQGERSPIMDGNVKRVFTRFFGITGRPGLSATEALLWKTAHAVLDDAPTDLDIRAYTQGLMDLGATVCTRRNPDCARCPLREDCYAREHAMQHALPTPRIRKAIPQRHCVMLVLEHDGRILLEQQPSPGIWGGLWSLPRFDDIAALEATLSNWDIRDATHYSLAPLTHAFSHFRLSIQPRHVITDGLGTTVAQPRSDQAWIAIDELPDVALPAPVQKLLHQTFCDAQQQLLVAYADQD